MTGFEQPNVRHLNEVLLVFYTNEGAVQVSMNPLLNDAATGAPHSFEVIINRQLRFVRFTTRIKTKTTRVRPSLSKQELP